jgi:hypothetical protein
MTEGQKKLLIRNMRHFGGGFVKQLAEAWALADKDNSRRLEKAFPEYVSKYRSMNIPSPDVEVED